MSCQSKNNGLRGLAAAAILVLSLAACQSAPDSTLFDQATLLGVVFDGASSGVQGFTVVLDGKASASSDVNGKFSFPAVERGHHRMVASKAGYRTVSMDFDFQSRSQILYVTSLSFRDCLILADAALQRRDYRQAQDGIESALELKPGDPVARYMQATVFTGVSRFGDAHATLEGLLADNVRETAVYLLMIDLAILDPSQRIATETMISADPYLSRLPEIAKAMERLRNTPTKETP